MYAVSWGSLHNTHTHTHKLAFAHLKCELPGGQQWRQQRCKSLYSQASAAAQNENEGREKTL